MPSSVTQTGEAEVSGHGLEVVPTVVEQVSPSVAAIVVNEGQSEGSGVIWSQDGMVVTNNHVVEGATDVRVVFATGASVAARIVATDPLTDLAVLEVDRGDVPPAQFADGLPRVGDLAIAMGNPLGFEHSVTAGIVSGVHRSIPSGGRTPALVDLIQTDAAISPGNSGGALVDGEARVIGINVAYIPPEAQAVAIGFAIPASTVVDVVEQLLDDGEAEHAFLGIEPVPITPQVAEQFGLDVEQGVLVRSVVEGSAAERAGIRPGDILVEADGERLETVEDLYAFLRKASPGDRVELRLIRDGDEQTVAVELAERPE
jgi:S1-C subfamily serine protease